MFTLTPHQAANRIFKHRMNSLFDLLEQPSSSIHAVDKGDKYEVNAVIPGFTNNDVKIEYDNEVLTISAERKEDNERAITASSFTRTISLPEADVDRATAELKNGILTISLPKCAKAVPKKITVK